MTGYAFSDASEDQGLYENFEQRLRDEEALRKRKSLEAAFIRQQSGQEKPPSIREEMEQHPWITAAAGFHPLLGSLISANDVASNTEKGEFGTGAEVLSAILPSKRLTRPIIAALDDLPDGGLKELIYRLEKAGLKTPKQLEQMWNDMGDLRMFHGTSDPGLQDLTTQGLQANLLRTIGTRTDQWAGGGTYKAANLGSPIALTLGRNDPDQNIRIFESYVPREELDYFPALNFDKDSDLYKMGYSDRFTFHDQTDKVKNRLEQMYGPYRSYGEDPFALYENSWLATDSPVDFSMSRAPDYSAQRANRPYSRWGHKAELKDLHEANQFAIENDIPGNFHSDSASVAANIQNPDMLKAGNIYDIAHDDLKEVSNDRWERAYRERVLDEKADFLQPGFHSRDILSRSITNDPDEFIDELIKREKIEPLVAGARNWYMPPDDLYNARWEALLKKMEGSSIPEMEEEVSRLFSTGDKTDAALASDLVARIGSLSKFKEKIKQVLP